MPRHPLPDPTRPAAAIRPAPHAPVPAANRPHQGGQARAAARLAYPAAATLVGGMLAALVTAMVALPAAAEALHCRAVNGNVTCSGSGAVSCQTVNGRTTCTGGNGAVVQQFGPAMRPAPPPAAALPEEEEDEVPEAAPEDRPPPARRSLWLERRGPAGHWLRLEREGRHLRLRSERLSLDLE